MAQAVIHINLDQETIERIADAVAQRVNGTVTQSNPPPSEPQTAWTGQNAQQQGGAPADDADPWGAQPAPSGASAPVQGQASAPTASQPANQQQQRQEGPPRCIHGQMIFRPSGVAKTGPRAGLPYPPFWACSAERNDPTKCKSLPVQ